ncbi:hypothetical protein CUMW_134700 [Citrus unshiu]|nr:hypothetical protein CUMW_134700 [Citrus unshiu]
MVLISVRHVTPHSLLRHFPLTQQFLPKQIPSLKNRIFSFTATATMSSTSKKVLAPVANGSEPIEAVITIDVLRRSGADVTVASVEKQLRVDACHGVKIVADALVSDCRDAVFDLIALPGGMPGATNLKESEVLESIVKKQASAGRLYAAVCASPAVALGSWGLLKGLKATCYPSFMEQLAPACASTVESRIQQDGKVVTSCGPGTTMEFAVALVEQLYGKERADEVSGPLVVMRANHGDEYTIAEFNPIQWTFDNSPQVRLDLLVSSTATMSSTSKKVLVPVANGSEPIEAVITIDVLRRSGADVTVASVEKQLRVDACHGVKIVADALVSDCRDAVFDLIALPGGMPGATNLKESDVLESIVKKQASAGCLYAAVCASPAVALGSWGLLKGLKDGKVVTSRGPGTTMEFAVALVEQLYGKERADEVSGPLVMRANHGDEYTIAEFNPIQWTFDNSPQILVPIANGSEEMEAVMIIDILRRAKANVVVASVEDKLEILASRQIKLVADVLIDEAAKLSYDLIVLPGGLGGAQAFAKSDKLVNMLKKQKESNRPYGAICASPALVLEPHGLLKGKKATAFPAMCNKLSDQSEIENRVVVDGNLITSRGPGTSMEFALAIVEKFLGRNKALELAKIMLFTRA